MLLLIRTTNPCSCDGDGVRREIKRSARERERERDRGAYSSSPFSYLLICDDLTDRSLSIAGT